MDEEKMRPCCWLGSVLGLQRLHFASSVAINWLKGTVMKARAKQKNK